MRTRSLRLVRSARHVPICIYYNEFRALFDNFHETPKPPLPGPRHHLFTRHCVRAGWGGGGGGAAGVCAALSAGGVGGARAGGDLADYAGIGARGGGESRRRRVHRRDRHRQSARDHGGVGAGERQGGAQRDCLAGPAHRGKMRGIGEKGRKFARKNRRENRVIVGRVFFRAENRLDFGCGGRRAPPRRGGRVGVRHD